MKLAVVGTVGVPASYGGFETLVEHLIEAEFSEFTVYCSGKHYKDRLESYKGARLVYLPFKANGVMSVIYDIFSILHGIATGHRKFLILGTSGAIIIPFLRLLLPSLKVVINIDGIEWRRSKWRGFAKIFLRFSEFAAVRFSHIVVADNDAIAEYIRDQYGRDCETIAYGGDHALVDSGQTFTHPNLDVNQKYALAICRIEPENNIKMILEAFSASENHLVFIGNWQTTLLGKLLLREFGCQSHLLLLDPIYDIETLFFLRSNCSAYIHGHSAGGTNPSLVEMMHFGKPIIAFDCKYNRCSMSNAGYYFKNAEHLQATFASLRQDQDKTMHYIAKERYTWEIVRQRYSTLFN